MGDEFEPTGEDLERMKSQALLSDLGEVLNFIDEILVMNQYYQREVTADHLRTVRADLARLIRDFN